MVTEATLGAILALRSERYGWKQIGLTLGLKPETCRRAVWAAKKASRTVGNPPATVNNLVPEV
ncbi:MAG: hypothetical protein L3K19_05940 [Thermoplasmata archaeon]|nr:hypothetical protein [Thermoplasmata archaeon]